MMLPDADGVNDTTITSSPFHLSSFPEMECEGAHSTSVKRRRNTGKMDSLQVGFLDNPVSLNGSPITDGDHSVSSRIFTLESKADG